MLFIDIFIYEEKGKYTTSYWRKSIIVAIMRERERALVNFCNIVSFLVFICIAIFLMPIIIK